MSMTAAKGGVREVSIEATVLGPCKHCGQGAEWWDTKECDGEHDHEPTFTRPLGTVARWHRSPAKRLWWRITGVGKE